MESLTRSTVKFVLGWLVLGTIIWVVVGSLT